MVTKAYKIYGADGHRQKQSFGTSNTYDWSMDGHTRIVSIYRADYTQTNEYVLLVITRDTADECEQELDGQLTDGFFEDCRTGDIVEVKH